MKNTYRKLLQKESPNLYKNYESIMLEQFELFAKKQLDYGISNISTGADLDTEEGKKFALSGLWFRMNDKIKGFDPPPPTKFSIDFYLLIVI